MPNEKKHHSSQRQPPQKEAANEGKPSLLVPPRKSRREFLKRTTAGALGTALGATLGGATARAEGRRSARRAAFQSRWPADGERVWLGPAYWANPLQDWRLAGGRAEMIGSGPEDRNVQLLTHSLGGGQGGSLRMRARLGFYEAPGQGRAGFMLGVQGPLEDYRSAAVYGDGLAAGLTSEGQLFIGQGQRTALSSAVDGERGVLLELEAAPQDSGGRYGLVLRAQDPETGDILGQVQRGGMQPEQLVGGVALLAGFEAPEGAEAEWGTPRLWFEDWQLEGDRVAAHPDRAFGPLLFNQYTLSQGTMKMTAQLPPVGADDDQAVRLQTQENGAWQTLAEAPVDALSRTATFRITDWDDARDVSYRLAYRYRTADGLTPHHYEGTVRRDPKEKEDLVVAGLSCQHNTGFPYSDISRGLRQHDPDLLAFTGDQYYESAGGFGVQRQQENLERAALDMLRKWYLHGWAFGDLRRDRPTICLPDDHDVYQGNIWGEGGKQVDRYELHNNGGYFMPAEWVNAVQRTQTAHLPDPIDPTPARNDITVYYTDMLYGGVSFAILEDRKWKSGPDGLVPAHPGRPDHVKDLNYDPSELDVPAAELLGSRQLDFLDAWAADWQGASMKAVVSQTAFAQVPTHHGADYMFLVADLDSNGWPQSPRDEAVRRMRKGLAFHLGGDQHLPMMLRYGLDDFDDAPYNFSVPAIATGYPRAFWPSEVPPEVQARFEPTGGAGPGGRYTDGLGNKVTLHAVANPEKEYRENVRAYLADKASGYGIVRFHKPQREITMEAWPILSDPGEGDGAQYAGWPKTIAMEENDGRAARGYLPTLEVSGATDPVVQVVDEENDEVLYTLRIRGQTFRPKVFRAGGTYTVRASREGETWQATTRGLTPAGEAEQRTTQIRL